MDAQIYTDGASRGNPGPCAYAFLIVRGDEVVARRSEYLGRCTNNEAEYTAVARAMEEALRLGIRRIRVHSDSRLVINQLSGRWRARNPRMRALAAGIRALAAKFDEVEFVNVPREDPLIGAVDAMCNETLDALRGAGAR
ncbi:MAG: ribonuclease HI family protein [Conexivisphaera sp.]